MSGFDIEQMPGGGVSDKGAKSRRVISEEEAELLPSRRYRPSIYYSRCGNSSLRDITMDTQWSKEATMEYLVRFTARAHDGTEVVFVMQRDEVMGYLRTE